MWGLLGQGGHGGQWSYDELLTPNKRTDYESVRSDAVKTVLEWTDSNIGWVHFDVVDGVTLESKVVANSGITSTRGTMNFKCNDFNKFVDNLFESSDESKKKIFEDMEANT